LRTKSIPMKENAYQCLNLQNMRINSQESRVQHLWSTARHKLADILPAVETYSRSSSPSADHRRDGRRRQTSQMQERWTNDRPRRWQEEKKGESDIIRCGQTSLSIRNAAWGNSGFNSKRKSFPDKKFTPEKLEKIKQKNFCNKLYGSKAPLHYAIQMNDVAKVRQLLKTSDPNIYHEDTGETPMHLASRLGKLHIVKLLRRHPKIDMELLTKSADKAVLEESNALQLAIHSGHVDVLDWLLHFKPRDRIDKDLLQLVKEKSREQEKVRKELGMLKPKIDTLKQENKELRKKIKELELEEANVMGANLPREKPKDLRNLAEVLKKVRELEKDLTAHQQHIWSEKEDEKQCTICAERQKDTVLVPCGHFFCSVCSKAVPICPNCRKRIERRVRTFDSSI